MNLSRLMSTILLILALASSSACTGIFQVTLGAQPPVNSTLTDPATEIPVNPTSAAPVIPTAETVAATSVPVQTSPASQGPAGLLFGIGMHIEPFGATPSQLVGNDLPGFIRKGDYHERAFFERHVRDIQTMAEIIERHGGRMTVQAQTPFTQVAIDTGSTVLSDLAASGNEISLHFHEDAHLWKNSEQLPVETWCAVMKEEIALVRQASGVAQVRYWSGGNLYPAVFEAAACAGLDINSDWKNPHTQTTPLELTGIHPWRPSGGTDGTDLRLFAQYDPQGEVIYLPEGLFEREDFASMRRSRAPDGDQAYFDFLARSLHDSLAAAQSGQVNVFHFTIHPGEFRGNPAHPFETIERFLTEVVDPLVASGQIRWATFSEMADAYRAWEQVHPGLDARAATIPDQELLIGQ